MQSWLEGRIWVGKCAQATGMTASLRILSSKADSNTWESFTRSGLKLESVHQESPRSDVFRKRATKPLLNQRQRHWAVEKKNWTIAQWSKVLFSDKSTFCFSFGNQGLEEEWRGTESKLLEVQCEVSEVSDDLGCRDVCWCWSIVFYQVQSQCSHLPGDFGALYASICWQAYGDADFLFQQDFSTCPQCQNHFQVLCWPWYYCAWLASQHAWPESHMESMGYFQEKDENQSIQQSRRAEGSIVPQQCHRLITSMTHLTDAGVCAKGAPNKYWVHKWTYFKELELFCFANPFFDWS